MAREQATAAKAFSLPPELQAQPYFKMPAQPRTKPMELLCLGLSRTGTMSLYVALKKLGYISYHAMELGLDKANGSNKRWVEALEAKAGNGNKEQRLETAADFDQLLWRYDAVTDIPCVLFASELLAAYPDAKVILMERDEDGWIRSVENSFYLITNMTMWRILALVDWDYARPFIALLHHSLRIWTDGDEQNRDKLREGYRRHNAHIHDVVSSERLLVYHPSRGWEPLCTFLGKPVLDKPMPKVNEGMFVANLFVWVGKARVLVVATKVAKVIVPVVVAVVGWWAYSRFGTR